MLFLSLVKIVVMSKEKVIEFTPEIAKQMKEIGLMVSKHRQAVNSNYKNFARDHEINNMTLWRIQTGKDYKMSTFLQVINAIGVPLEDIFKGIK